MIEGHDRSRRARGTPPERGVMVERGLRKHALGWLDPRPFDAETVAVEPQARGEVEVFLVALIAVAGVARRVLERGRVIVSSSQLSEVVLPPSLWCAEIAVPQRKPLGRGLAGLAPPFAAGAIDAAARPAVPAMTARRVGSAAGGMFLSLFCGDDSRAPFCPSPRPSAGVRVTSGDVVRG